MESWLVWNLLCTQAYGGSLISASEMQELQALELNARNTTALGIYALKKLGLNVLPMLAIKVPFCLSLLNSFWIGTIGT